MVWELEQQGSSAIVSDTNNVREDPDGEDQGSKFTAEDGGEIRSRELRECGYCEYLQRRQAVLWSMLEQQDDANMEKYDHTEFKLCSAWVQ